MASDEKYIDLFQSDLKLFNLVDNPIFIVSNLNLSYDCSFLLSSLDTNEYLLYELLILPDILILFVKPYRIPCSKDST